MPSAAASRGVPSETGSPSKRTSPASEDWAPDRPLIRVDLPAPLSPTSAVTLPASTLMFTPLSTSTGPKLLRMSRSSMIGTATGRSSPVHRGLPVRQRLLVVAGTGRVDADRVARDRRPPGCPVVLLDALLRAERRDVALADVGDVGVPVVEDLLHVVGGDDDRRLGDERRAVVGLLVHAGLVPVQQLDGEVGRGLRLELERLVDRAGLLAEQDVLQGGGAGVLAADRHRLAVLVEHRDDARGVGVVGRPDGVDVAAERGVGLLEERAGLGAVPGGLGLERRLDPRGGHDSVGAVVDLLGVAVGRVATDLDDLRRRRDLAGGLEAVDDHLAVERTDVEVVEGDVVVRALDRAV